MVGQTTCDVEFSNTWYGMYVAIMKIRVTRMSKLEFDSTMVNKNVDVAQIALMKPNKGWGPDDGS